MDNDFALNLTLFECTKDLALVAVMFSVILPREWQMLAADIVVHWQPAVE